MIKISLICVGNLKEKYLKEAVLEYSKRLSSYCKLEIIELKEGRNIDEEGKAILKKMTPSSYKIALDLKGKELSSEEFAAKIASLSHSTSHLTFLIGGSEGLSTEVKSACDYSLSFSKLTFPHQLMRVIFLEQLYRAFKINKNETYHK